MSSFFNTKYNYVTKSDNKIGTSNGNHIMKKNLQITTLCTLANIIITGGNLLITASVQKISSNQKINATITAKCIITT